ncbi:MAG: type II secretion system protein [Armatimonadota bacterium]
MRIHYSSGFTMLELVIALAVLIVLGIVLYPVFTRTREGHRPNCLNNQRQLAIGILSYAQDNNETLPMPEAWVTATGLQSDPKVFDCPTNRREGTPGQPDYGMNAFLYDTDPKNGNRVGVPWGNIKEPSSVELTADITGATEKGTRSTASNPFPGTCTVNGFDGAGANADWRHGEVIIVSYVDGHTERVSREKLSGTGRTRYQIPMGKKPAEGEKK